MAKSKVKDTVLDYLWEWANEQGDWAKVLVSYVAHKEDNLSDAELQDVYEHLVESKKCIAAATAKPSNLTTTSVLCLKSLKDLKGVNRLATGQSINFADNMTVIYGYNGAGKTGYARVLKSLGFSYGTQGQILPNLYSMAPPSVQTAYVEYSIDGQEDALEWQGDSNSGPLDSLSVFDSGCVNIGLNDGRSLVVTPIGFHLFQIAAQELERIDRIIEGKIEKLELRFSWANHLHAGTEVHSFISNLGGKSNLNSIKSLLAFGDGEQQALKDLEAELSSLNVNLINTEIQLASNQISELEALEQRLGQIQKIINSENGKSFIDNRKSISDLQSTQNRSLEVLEVKYGVELSTSTQFKAFVEAGDRYAKHLGKEEYPAADDICLYCRQPLNTGETVELIRMYSQLLSDLTQQQIKALETKNTQIINNIKQLNLLISLPTKPFGEHIPGELLCCFEDANNLKERLTSSDDELVDVSMFTLDVASVIKTVQGKLDELRNNVQKRRDTLTDLGSKEKNITAKINELKDRQLLASKIHEVEQLIENYKQVDRLRDKQKSVKTVNLSRKSTLARDELISRDFRRKFDEELRAFRKANIPLNMDFKTDKGQCKIKQTISSHKLCDVLSEGEQKAIALAEFLAELTLDDSSSPVVFDDPVTSLDHHIIDDVARRLLRLSRSRQVVIFTHSILLYNSILEHSEASFYSGLKFKYFELSSDGDLVGYVNETRSPKDENFGYYQSKINSLLCNTPKAELAARELEIVTDGYGNLRSGIEVLVERDIFQNVIRRYRKGVALTNFPRIKMELILTHRETIYEIYERCCGNGPHSSPVELTQKLTITDLANDFNTIQDIYRCFSR